MGELRPDVRLFRLDPSLLECCLVCGSTVRCLQRFQLPAAFPSLGTHPCDSITESARTTEELDTGAAKRGRLKRLTLLSSIKASTIVDSRSSFLNFKFPASPPWNLIWEWRLSLPSFSLANRQTAVYFPNYIRTRLRVGYGTSGPTTTGATTDLFWRQADSYLSQRVNTTHSSNI